MNRWHAVRPTRAESVLAVVLLCVALAEAVFSDEQPAPTLVRVTAAVVPPVAVAFSRTWPEGAAAAVVAVFLLDSMTPSPAGTLGAGFAWLAVVFAVAAWSRQPGPWLLALVVAGTMRDLRAADFEASDVVIDWAFFAAAAGVGHLVRRRTAQAEMLATRLEIADAEREAETAQAVTRERAAIARELHDVVAHAVSLMVVQAGTARPMAERIDRELAGVLETIENTGREALTELRRLLHVLRTTDEADVAPLPDLHRVTELVDGIRRAGVPVRSALVIPPDVPAGVALCAYRTVQEGLTNAMRHSDGSPIDVEVSSDSRTLRVRVRSRGGAATTEALGTGTGLIGLRERVLLCGGRLSAGPDACGYLLDVTLPLSAGSHVTDDPRTPPIGAPS
ncbi:sensor histidine kinase [Fodinibacter luteus]|uniref:histidine kinase n=1 Tax=Fodinibacter luteus TaxID=552064 RepID=A0ABP8K1G2_9MICO